MLSRSWRQQPPSLLSLGGGVWFDLTCFPQSELSVAVAVVTSVLALLRRPLRDRRRRRRRWRDLARFARHSGSPHSAQIAKI